MTAKIRFTNDSEMAGLTEFSDIIGLLGQTALNFKFSSFNADTLSLDGIFSNGSDQTRLYVHAKGDDLRYTYDHNHSPLSDGTLQDITFSVDVGGARVDVLKLTNLNLDASQLNAAIFADQSSASSSALEDLLGGLGWDIIGTDERDIFTGVNEPHAETEIDLSGNDFVRLRGGNDIFDAGSGHDTLLGGNGHDRLIGGAGADTIKGGRGDDRLAGGSGSDTMLAGAGDDILLGQAGNDIMTGGNGSDTFVFKGNTGRDIITDYQGDIDRLDIHSKADISIKGTDDGFRITWDSNVVFLETDATLDELVII